MNALIGATITDDDPPASTDTERQPMTGYLNPSCNVPQGWNPFDPDALGALIEARDWINNPRFSSADRLEYRVCHFEQLTEMLRRAIKKARLAEQQQRRSA